MNTAPNLPAWLQSAPPSSLADTLGQNLGGAAPPYLSIMGNRLTLVDASGDQEPVTTVDPKTGLPYLDCCIADVGDHASKIYYGKAFDPNATAYSPPDCWSDNGVAPSINASVPQAKTCTPDPTNVHGCRWAVWGSKVSAVSGKGVPACAKYQKLALLIPGDDVVFLLRVPPNSLDNLRSYNAKFKGQPVGPEGVITRISFESQELGTLTFAAVSYVDEDTWKRRQAALAAKVTDTLVGRGDQPHPAGGGQALPPPPAGGGQALPLPASATTVGALSTPLAAPALPAPAAAMAPAAEPTRRRRRTAAEMVAAQNPPAAGVQAGGQPAPFRPAEPLAAAGPLPASGGFGIAQGVPPNAEVQAAINSIFGPK